MVRVEVIDNFTLGKFNELKNIQRIKTEEKGRLFIGDTFECSEEMADYLIKTNAKGKAFVKVIEVIPDKKPEDPEPKHAKIVKIEKPKEEPEEPEKKEEKRITRRTPRAKK